MNNDTRRNRRRLCGIIIEYRIKNVYGADLKYPVSRDAILACALNGSKTLTDSAITIIKEVYPNSTFNQVL